MKSILEAVGLPAMLEQTAEECVELAHACLKYARYLRGENPTPKTETECIRAIHEEMADVSLCVEIMRYHDASFLDDDRLDGIMNEKLERWKNRLRKED